MVFWYLHLSSHCVPKHSHFQACRVVLVVDQATGSTYLPKADKAIGSSYLWAHIRRVHCTFCLSISSCHPQMKKLLDTSLCFTRLNLSNCTPETYKWVKRLRRIGSPGSSPYRKFCEELTTRCNQLLSGSRLRNASDRGRSLKKEKWN